MKFGEEEFYVLEGDDVTIVIDEGGDDGD